MENLSFAGRATLIQSVLAGIPTYTMRTRLIKLFRTFLQGSTQEKRKLHLVNWKNVVTNKKSKCGLNIGGFCNTNSANLPK